MREIKFRAWDKKEKQMLEPFTTEDFFAGEELMFNSHADCEFMQYTGLKDKNGKEIYEGDILKGYFNPDDVEDYIYISLTAEEKESGTRLFTVEDIFYPYTNPLPDDLEIIGNIYQNKELL